MKKKQIKALLPIYTILIVKILEITPQFVAHLRSLKYVIVFVNLWQKRENRIELTKYKSVVIQG